MTPKVKITAVCGKCGEFKVLRARKKREGTDGHTYDLPASVVCPGCRMWSIAIIKVVDIIAGGEDGNGGEEGHG